MGDALADEVKRVLAEYELTIDVVIPVCPLLCFCTSRLHLTATGS